MKYKFSDELFITAVKESVSLRQVMLKLGVIAAGGNYMILNNRIRKLNLSTSHFLGHGANKGRKFGAKRPIKDYLENKIKITSYKLKNKLIADKILKYECNNCHCTQWLDKPIPLELHHKDGNNQNNNLSNLELLCPNCHTLTDSYRGKKLIKSEEI